ncbi:hypothetical protein ABB30_09910 [Stenotrophomonas ginsengisoli]|uniref:Uncharacterized protein n=1 Tax=Stenotrophomonas ginsengisoli TaxID=336566 RepID=A0A0R0D4A6_9GAMM|nr:hypothetical protein [Stenotrophomonas ginsengisoli]KRG76304.1 hypothetical protein ABB30_09910 [Stenotrophomonas ginsengisoli]
MKTDVSTVIACLQGADPRLAQLADGRLWDGAAAALSPAGQALLRALLDQQAVTQAQAEVSAVADILRRDQKFAPPGRPSLHLVQLRRQQSAVQQAERLARQVAAASASGFIKQAGLTLKPGIAAGEFMAKWVARLPL